MLVFLKEVVCVFGDLMGYFGLGVDYKDFAVSLINLVNRKCNSIV